MLRKIWEHLTPEECDRMILMVAEAQVESPNHDFILSVATKANVRHKTLMKSDAERLARFIRSAIWRVGSEARGEAFCRAFVIRLPEKVERLYAALGLTPDGTMLPDEVKEQSLESSVVIEAVTRLRVEWESMTGLVMLGAIAEGGLHAWRPGVETAIETILEEMEAESAGTDLRFAEESRKVKPEVSAAQEEKFSAETERPSIDDVDPNVFTALDRLLIKTVVESLNGEIGAFHPDEVEDIIQEILDLSSSRIRSRFHEGFIDALQHRPATEGGSGTNEDRECWYLVGYFMAKLRTHPRVDVLQMVEALPPERKRLLVGGDLRKPARELLPHLVRAAMDSSDVSFVTRALSAEMRFDPNLFWKVAQWVEEVLIDSDAEMAIRLIDLLEIWIASADPENFDNELPSRFCIKIRVTASRLLGDFASVERIAQDFFRDPPPLHPSMWVGIPGSVALARLGIRDVAEIGLGLDDDPLRLASRIRREFPDDHDEPWWRGWPPTAVLSAMPAVLDRESDTDAARSVLKSAIDEMITKKTTVWPSSGLLHRARILLSILEIESGDVVSLTRAINRSIGAIGEFPDVDSSLVIRLFEAVVMANAPSADLLRLSSILLERTPRDVLTNVNVEDLARVSEGFRNEVRDRLSKDRAGLLPLEHLNVLLGLARGGAVTNMPDAEFARWAFDEAASLSTTDTSVAHQLVGRLIEDRVWEGIIDEDEADSLILRLLDGLGSSGKYQGILLKRLNAAASDQRWNEASDYLDLWDEMKFDESAVEAMRRRITAMELDARSERRDPLEDEKHLYRDLQIVFVGGNETQEQYRLSLEETFARKFSGIRLTFHFPGWSANWSPVAERVKADLESADAMVLMPMIRTMFGRTVRAEASRQDVPWIACTGRGRASLERAILEAVRVAVQQRRATPKE